MRQGGLVMDEREAMATSILKTVRIVSAGAMSAQVVRRMMINGEDHEMNMILAIQGRKGLYTKNLGAAGQKFESLMNQILRVWDVGLPDFISCGISMLNEKTEVNAMHVLMLLRSRMDDVEEQEEAIEPSGRPTLILIRRES